MKRLVITLALVPLLVLAACEPADQDIADDVDTTGVQFQDELRNFRMDAEARLADMDESLDSLEVELQAAGQEAQAEFNDVVVDLRDERDALQRDLQQLQTSTEATFQSTRANIERRLEELENDIEQAYADLRNGDEVQEEVPEEQAPAPNL